MLDALDGALLETLGSYSLLAAAMLVSWRVAKRAHTDAVTLYKAAAADADSRLEIERKMWADERAQLLERLDRHARMDDSD